eukprot:c21055_g1_i4.p1 GENE.c21055_g1_i4~~c21055_g1_i4.p1  ORF type:complete len:635 (+),score=205.40 c21055_g1_i4:20-1924(+)
MRLTLFLLFLFILIPFIHSQSECAEESHPLLEKYSDTTTCVGSHCVSRFIYRSPSLEVVSISPNCGPIEGNTIVKIIGNGIREFGSLMVCKFQFIKVPAVIKIDNITNPFNNKRFQCVSPQMNSSRAVDLEISLTGEAFTTNTQQFYYYNHPILSSVSPSIIDTIGSQNITISGSGFSGNSNHSNAVYSPKCKFTFINSSSQWNQYPLYDITDGIILSDTQFKCPTVSSFGVMNVLVTVSLNGQNFSPSGVILTFKDNWIKPAFSGRSPPLRVYHTLTFLSTPPRLVLFGGTNGVFLNDVYVLDLNVLGNSTSSVEYSAFNFGWLDFSSSSLTTGQLPSPRCQHAAVGVGSQIYIYGGITNFYDTPSDELFLLQSNSYIINPNTAIKSSDSLNFELVNTTGSSPGPRALHSLNYAIISNKKSLVLFGGRSLGDCGFTNNCYFNFNDVWIFDIDSSVWRNMTTTTPPSPRSAHAAVVMNGSPSYLWIFGGEIFDETAQISTFPYLGGLVVQNDLHKLNLETGEWTIIHTNNNNSNSFPSPRMSHSIVTLNNRHILLFGGALQNSLQPLNDIWVFDTNGTLTWSYFGISNSPSSRFGHSVAGIDSSRMILFGGMTTYGVTLNDLYLFDSTGDSLLW